MRYLPMLLLLCSIASAQIPALTPENIETECNKAIERAKKDAVAIDADVATLEKGAAIIKTGKAPAPLSLVLTQPLVMERLKDLSFCIESAPLFQKSLVVLHADQAKDNLWASWYNLVLGLLHVQKAATDHLQEAGAACFALHPAPPPVTVPSDLRRLSIDCQTFHIPGSSTSDTTCDTR
jgi:hypothetical protein